MKPVKVVFPQGPCDQKTRYLIEGFRRVGLTVLIHTPGPKIGVTPFSVHFDSGAVVSCGHDIGCLDKAHLSQGKGEINPWWKGKADIFFFKVHATPAVLNSAARVFPMPQALGRNEFLPMIEGLRKARKSQKPAYDVFGLFTGGGSRAEACRRIKAGIWTSLVGIGRGRKGEGAPANDVYHPLMEMGGYFKTMATTRLALSVPSHGAGDGPWTSYRHVEAWALGVPVLTFKPKNYNVFGAPGAPLPCWVEVEDDFSNLADKVNEALGDADLLRWAGENAARYFDEHLSPEAHAAHVLRTIEGDWK